MLAPEDSDYVLENPHNLPLTKLYKQFFPLKQSSYSKPVSGTETEGYSTIYRNAASVSRIKKFIVEGAETVHSNFEIITKENPDNECFKFREYDYDNEKSKAEYTSFSYQQVKEMKDQLGSGIMYHLLNNPFKDATKYSSHRLIDTHIENYSKYNEDNVSFIVTLYSGNRWEWLLTDLACASYSITDTALYDTLGENTSEYILELTQSPIIFCSKQHINGLIQLKNKFPEKLGNVISIVSMDPLFSYDNHLKDRANDINIKLLDFNQMIGLGKIFPLPNLTPNCEALYTISFTSGTTGSNPKGVCLTQQAASSSLAFLLTTLPITRNSLSFLPYAHIFERETVFFTLATGGCVILPQLNYSPLTLVEDLKLCKPERISLVPRVYNKFEAAIKNATIHNPNFSDFKKGIFKKIFDTKIELQSRDDFTDGKTTLYDKLVINKIKSQFGFDNIAYAITGSAPIDPDTVKFLRASLQFGLCQGYGLTETFAGICITQPYEAAPGSSGPPALNTEMKLRAIPEMNYNIDDVGGPRGELLIRSHQNFSSYYKNPKETAKALDKDGWFSTGDIARIDKTTGRVYIIDRVKNFFKLAQGEYISPEVIENNYQSSNPILSQLYVHGDSLKTFLVGVLGIDKANLINFLSKHCGISIDELNNVTDQQILKFINDRKHKTVLINFLNQSVPQLKGFQKLRNVAIEFEPLTLERNVVTPTMKLKRPIAKQFFDKVLTQLYEEGSLTDAKL